MIRKRNWTITAIALSVLAGGSAASAQEGQKEKRARVEVRGDVVVARTQDPHGAMAGADVLVDAARGQSDTFVFVSSEMSIDGKIVKGAPYSAQSVTEMVQTLGDGNRIVRKNSANVYRDSEGRTRRDQTLGAIGPFAAGGDPPQTVFINDPVAGVNYILDPRSRTARKMPRMEFDFEFGEKEPGDKLKTTMKMKRPAPGQKEVETSGYVFTMPAGPPDGPGPHGRGPLGPGPEIHFFGHSSKAEAKTEKLEKRDIEGVEAEGTRTTVTIPAGEIGNEQPILIVSERWYSPELQTVVMTRHSDPRFGENTYRLTNISRTEPPSTLFQVPGDYTVKNTGVWHQKMRSRKPAESQ